MFTFFVYPAEFAIETAREGVIPQHFIAVIMAGMDLIAFLGGLSFCPYKEDSRKRHQNRRADNVRVGLRVPLAAGRMGRHHYRLSPGRFCQRPGDTFYHFHGFPQSRQICCCHSDADAVDGSLSGPIHDSADAVSHHKSRRRNCCTTSALFDSVHLRCPSPPLVASHQDISAFQKTGTQGLSWK